MKIREILGSKGHDVVTVQPDLAVLAAMKTLVEHNIGSVVVTEDGEVAGILTERDILRMGARDPASLTTTRVGDAMTTDLVVGFPDDRIEHVMEIMTENRVRHLPVLHEEKLAGIVSIGDVVNALRKDAEHENEHLRRYIQGAVR